MLNVAILLMMRAGTLKRNDQFYYGVFEMVKRKTRLQFTILPTVGKNYCERSINKAYKSINISTLQRLRGTL